MESHEVFIKLYGAAGAALDKLNDLGDGVRVPEILEARRILAAGIAAAEEILEAEE